jgi:1,6-anhydro-N-acetylmuramate kinase
LVEVLPSDLATYREAMSFAILGALCQDRIPITLPRVTGCPDPAPISGAWILP